MLNAEKVEADMLNAEMLKKRRKIRTEQICFFQMRTEIHFDGLNLFFFFAFEFSSDVQASGTA
jgi:hypothetical protein